MKVVKLTRDGAYLSKVMILTDKTRSITIVRFKITNK